MDPICYIVRRSNKLIYIVKVGDVRITVHLTVHSKVWPDLIVPHIRNHYKWHHIIKRFTPSTMLIIRFL